MILGDVLAVDVLDGTKLSRIVPELRDALEGGPRKGPQEWEGDPWRRIE